MKVTNDVLLERIDNLIDRNATEHKEMRDGLSGKIVDLDERVKILENWKLVFVAKFSIYASIALFVGSLVSTLAFDLVKNWMIK